MGNIHYGNKKLRIASFLLSKHNSCFISSSDFLKDHKTSLERIRVTHSGFSCYDTISRGTVR